MRRFVRRRLTVGGVSLGQPAEKAGWPGGLERFVEFARGSPELAVQPARGQRNARAVVKAVASVHPVAASVVPSGEQAAAVLLDDLRRGPELLQAQVRCIPGEQLVVVGIKSAEVEEVARMPIYADARR